MRGHGDSYAFPPDLFPSTDPLGGILTTICEGRCAVVRQEPAVPPPGGRKSVSFSWTFSRIRS